jgi:hypothetical protein
VFVNNEKPIKDDRLAVSKGGPKTEAGKAAVRLNAVSHGLLSKALLLPGEDVFELTALRESYLNELNPQGEMESLLVERIVTSAWRLKRAMRYEQTCNKRGLDYRFGNWETYMRYETALERQIYKALRELQELRKTRFFWQWVESTVTDESGTPAQPPSEVAEVLDELKKFYRRNPGLSDDQPSLN